MVGIISARPVTAPEASGADWPRWGGTDPGRNMYSDEKGLPDRFEPGKPKAGSEEIDLATTKNVKWAAKLGSHDADFNRTVRTVPLFLSLKMEGGLVFGLKGRFCQPRVKPWGKSGRQRNG